MINNITFYNHPFYESQAQKNFCYQTSSQTRFYHLFIHYCSCVSSAKPAHTVQASSEPAAAEFFLVLPFVCVC